MMRNIKLAVSYKLCKLKSYSKNFVDKVNKEELLNDKEFYKPFKNGEDLISFFNQMHKQAVEHMLNAESDAHLDNEKHEKKKSSPPLVRLKLKFQKT